MTARVRFALAVLVALAACAKREPPPDPGVHTLALPSLEPTLVEGPGRAEVVANCRTCHSPRYIDDQPRFTRKVWSAEVEKMRATYGAPIPSEQVPAIVDYLVATHGKED